MIRIISITALTISIHSILVSQWISAPGSGMPPFGVPVRAAGPAGVSRVGETGKGDLLKQVKMFERWFGESGQPDPESRTAIHGTLEAQGEAFSPKHGSLSSPPAKWEFRGPLGMEVGCDPGTYFTGRINALAWSPTRGMYFGAAHGGLWGPIPFGVVPLTDQLPSLVTGDVAVDPVNPDVIYYGTGDYMTGGNGTPGTGVYRSPDAGKFWDKLPLTPTPTKVSRILIAPWNHDIVLISTDVGIYRYPDTNGVWGRVRYGDWSDLAAASNGSVLLAARAGVGVSRSTDGGLHWTELTGFPTSFIGNIKLAISASDPNRAYVAMARPLLASSSESTGHIRVIYTTSNLLAATPSWTDVTPAGDNSAYLFGQGWYHNEIEVHPTSPGTVYAAGGTILKSTNSGATWTHLSNFPHDDIRSVSFRPGDNLLHVAGDGGVFTSSDGGATWDTQINRLLPTALFYNISVGKSDDNVVFAAAQDNSTDGTSPGDRDTWKVFNWADGIDVRVDWSDENVVWTSTQFGYVYRTTNGGPEAGCGWPQLNDSLTRGTEWETTIWQEPQFQDWIYYNSLGSINYSSNKGTDWGLVNDTWLNDGANYLYVETNTDGSELYALTNSSYWPVVRYHYEGGNTWTFSNISSGLPKGIPVRIVTSQSHPSRAFVIMNGGGPGKRIWRTTSRGTSWSDITGDLMPGIKLFDILEDPYNPSVLYIGTDHGAFKTTNTGATWGWWSAGMPGAVWVSDLEYAYSPGGDYVAAGTFGRGVYERDADAPAYYPIYASGSALSSLKGGGGLVLVSGAAGLVSKSTNAGLDWSNVSVPSGPDLGDIHFIDSLKYFAVGAGGTIFATIDGGANWTAPLSPTGYQLRRMTFVSGNDGFAAGDSGVLLKTTDGGETWEDASPGLFASFFDIFFTDEMHGFLAGHVPEGVVNERRFLKTTDGGQTWDADPSLQAVGSFFDIFFSDPLNGFMTTENGSLMKTTDGGGSWSEYPTGFTTALLGCHFTTPMKGWVCGVEGLVLATTDGGETWTQEETGTPADLAAIGLVGGDVAVAGSTGLLARPVHQPTEATFSFKQGWNLVSLPYGLEDYSATSVFPGVASNLYSFNGGYEEQTALENGKGYWAKFNGPAYIPVTGFPALDAAIDVVPGWNLIGSIAHPLGVSQVVESPEGIIASSFYGYDGGYSATGTLDPGSGYWVKVSEEGQLLLRAGVVRLSDSVRQSPGGMLPRSLALLDSLNRLEVTDSRGLKQVLRYSVQGEDESLMAMFQAPPPPPAGGFDVRFSSGTLVEYARAGSPVSAGITLTGASYPVSIRWDERRGGPSAYLRLREESISLSGAGSVTLTGPLDEPTLILSAAPGEDLPSAYALLEGYPNPFNPSTTVRYELPAPSRVTIVVYDLLGRAAATLVDGVEDAGRKSVTWNADGKAGGVYFVRMEASGFSAVRKIVLLR